MTNRIGSRTLLGLIGTVLLAGSPVVLAHHSTAMFDMKKTVKVQGTVESFEWTNPHTWIWLEVSNGSNGTVRWGIEGMSPNYLSRTGWTHGTLKAGDKVTVDVHPLRDGREGGFCVSVTLANGQVLSNLPGP